MANAPIQSQSCGELTDDDTHGSFASNSSDNAINSLSTISGRLKLLWFRLPWRHISILVAILMTGLVVGILVQVDARQEQAHHWFGARLLLGNAATIFVGFGFAIYGCLINRQLRQKIQHQERLGPYTLHELIGSGGMGDVYLAEHQLLKRKCAIKLIRRDRASDRRMLARFEREVKATAQLTQGIQSRCMTMDAHRMARFTMRWSIFKDSIFGSW